MFSCLLARSLTQTLFCELMKHIERPLTLTEEDQQYEQIMAKLSQPSQVILYVYRGKENSDISGI